MSKFKRLSMPPVCWSIIGAAIVVLHGTPIHRLAPARPGLTLVALMVGCLLLIPRIQKCWRPWINSLYTMPRRVFQVGLFILALAANLLVVWESFDGIPRIDDGVAALFQARIFARGALTLPLPAGAGFFEVFGVLGERADLGHWAGMYPPGWSLLLTPGVLMGTPWIVNPILGGLLLLAIHALGREFISEKVGRTAAILGLLSPMVLSLSGSHLSHVPTALFSTLCFLTAHRLVRTGQLRYGLLAGLCWSGAFLCRPLCALVIGATIGIGLLARPGEVLKNWRGVAIALLLAAAGVGALMLFQHHITGDAFTAGHEIGMGKRGKFGYGEIDHARTHTIEMGLRHTIWRIRAMNDNLTGWLIPAGLLALIPFIRRRATLDHLRLLLPYPALLFAYNFYWYYEVFFEARYTFVAVPMLLVVVAHGVHLLIAWADDAAGRFRLALLAVPVVSILFLGIVAIPLHFDRYDSRFGDVEGILPTVVRACGITNAVVFMDAIGVALQEEDPRNNYYATGFLRNDLDLTNDVIYARNSREQNFRITTFYPNRSYYLYRYERGLNQAVVYRLIPENNQMTVVPMAPMCDEMIPHFVYD
ncbi:MAG: glycosyltransferase family 39 protein [Verrucomicrobia bacterium]|nr:glycosyltransferase family 39 protein [Verrucomicrobiota bacterium]